MKQIDVFTFAPLTEPYEERPLRTELYLRGLPTGKTIPGFILEAQYQHGDYFLIVTSWDCPYEESQNFVLLSNELDVLVAKRYGAMYASIWLTGHQVHSENSAMFQCDDDVTLIASITPRGRLVLDKYDTTTGKAQFWTRVRHWFSRKR